MRNTRVNKTHLFIKWIVTCVVLGLLPWCVNFLVHLITDSINFYSIFSVTDLMFFVIVLSATSMFDLLSQRIFAGISSLVLFSVFLFLLVLAAIFLGISSYYIAVPPTSGLFTPVKSRLIICSLILSTLTLVITFSIQTYTCYFMDRQVTKNGKHNINRNLTTVTH